MGSTPIYVYLGFVFTTALTVFLFYIAFGKSKSAIGISLFWLLLQSSIALSGFYTITDTMPPRLLLAVAPALALIIILFITKIGLSFIDKSDIGYLILLNTVRIPVELALLWLHKAEKIPVEMTFEGWNFDILSGITAPFIWWLYRKGKLSNLLLFVWNTVCFLLLINIVVIAILSAPSPFRQLGGTQPNIAVLYAPFVWLPSFIVPIVILSHITIFRKIAFGFSK